MQAIDRFRRSAILRCFPECTRKSMLHERRAVLHALEHTTFSQQRMMFGPYLGQYCPYFSARLCKRIQLLRFAIRSPVLYYRPLLLYCCIRYIGSVASARRSGQEDCQRGTPPVSLASCSISPFLRAFIITE